MKFQRKNACVVYSMCRNRCHILFLIRHLPVDLLPISVNPKLADPFSFDQQPSVCFCHKDISASSVSVVSAISCSSFASFASVKICVHLRGYLWLVSFCCGSAALCKFAKLADPFRFDHRPSVYFCHKIFLPHPSLLSLLSPVQIHQTERRNHAAVAASLDTVSWSKPR